MTIQACFSKSPFQTARRRISEDLHDTIEQMRQELIDMSTISGFSSENVLELSQRLDKYIVLAQRQMRRDSHANIGL